MHLVQGFSIDGLGEFQTIPSPPALVRADAVSIFPSIETRKSILGMSYTGGAGTV